MASRPFEVTIDTSGPLSIPYIVPCVAAIRYLDQLRSVPEQIGPDNDNRCCEEGDTPREREICSSSGQDSTPIKHAADVCDDVDCRPYIRHVQIYSQRDDVVYAHWTGVVMLVGHCGAD